jgi:hypothetical protein
MLPLLYEHFRLEGVTSEMFLMDWMMSLFTKVRAVATVYCASYGAVSVLCCTVDNVPLDQGRILRNL